MKRNLILFETELKDIDLDGVLSFWALKFVYSEKAKKFCEIFTLLLSTVNTDKRKVEISQNFVAFSEYMNFRRTFCHHASMSLLTNLLGKKPNSLREEVKTRSVSSSHMSNSASHSSHHNARVIHMLRFEIWPF